MLAKFVQRQRLKRTLQRKLRRSKQITESIRSEEQRALEAHAEADEAAKGYNNARAVHAFSVFQHRRSNIRELMQEQASAEIAATEARKALLEFGVDPPAPNTPKDDASAESSESDPADAADASGASAESDTAVEDNASAESTESDDESTGRLEVENEDESGESDDESFAHLEVDDEQPPEQEASDDDRST